MKHEITKGDIRKIMEEIEYRKVTERKELLVHVTEARAHGDLSDNFEYYAAKKEKNKNEGRIRYLERMIKTSSVIEDFSSKNQVGVNNTVRVYFEEEKEEELFRIVTTVRQNSLTGMISVESPLGKALLGHEIEDRVEIIVNNSFSYFIIIKEIIKTEDESKDVLRDY
jgi:transcription elongation factor GreA